MRGWLAGGLLAVSGMAFGQASDVQFSAVVCGPAGLSGVTYVTSNVGALSCGTDSNGNALQLQVSTLSGEQPVEGGEQVGLDIGGAVLSVLAVAWAFRFVRRYIESSGES